MSNKHNIFALFIILNLSCAMASGNGNQLPDDMLVERSGAIPRIQSQISLPDTEADISIANTGTIQLERSSVAFKFLARKKGGRYKIPRNGCVTQSQISQFIECLGDDIASSQSLLDSLLALIEQYESKKIEERDYLKSLEEYGLREESNIAQYLSNTEKRLSKLEDVRADLTLLVSSTN